MYTITYSSTVNVNFTDAELATYSRNTRAANLISEITGALLYRNGRIIQVLEGPEIAVRNAFARIVADPRQTVNLAGDSVIAMRRFTTWTMGFRPLSDDSLSGDGEFNSFFASSQSRLNSTATSAGGQTMFDWLYSSWLVPELRPSPSPKRTDATQFYRSQRVSTGPLTASADVPAPGARSVLLVSPQADSSAAANTQAAERGQSGGSQVVSAIVDFIVGEVRTGVLVPGDRVSDLKLSKQLGVSRTPVREALQRLREIGIVEVAANRFTRIAIVDPDQAAKLRTVLAGLFSMVLDEVIGTVDVSVIDQMRADRRTFCRAREAGSVMSCVSAAADFFLRLVTQSKNSELRKHIQAIVHVIQLAAPHLDTIMGLDVLATSLDETLAATIDGNTARAKRALVELSDATTIAAMEDPSSSWII